MSNTGIKAYTNLEQYYLDNGVATGITKPNNPSDPDYVAPVLDLAFCPLPSASPSVTPSITVTPTPTLSVTPSISISTSVPISPSSTPSVTPSISISVTPSVTPSITPSVTPSISVGYAPFVAEIGANIQSCLGGCNDTLGWYITLTSPVTVNTNYTLAIDLYLNGIPSYTHYASGVILAGNVTDTINNCTDGAYIGCNYSVNSICVIYIDTPVNPSTFAC